MAQNNRLLRPGASTTGGIIAPPPAAVTYYILQENLNRLLTEGGDLLRKEQSD
jgi:hypothetical protein